MGVVNCHAAGQSGLGTPQYSLAYGAVSQNLFPEHLPTGEMVPVFGVRNYLLAVTAITLCYGNEGVGIKIYEWVLKGIVAGIVLVSWGGAENFDIG